MTCEPGDNLNSTERSATNSIDNPNRTSVRPPFRWFYMGIAVFMTVLVLNGFGPGYFFPLLGGNVPEVHWVIHLHGAIFIGWMALLLIQVALVALGKTSSHRKLGSVGIAYGFSVLLMGLIAGFVTPVLHVSSGEWDVDRAAGFLLVILGDMALWGGFFGAAVFYRRKPQIHKRLILLATVALLFAAIGRNQPIEPLILQLAVWLSPILLAMAFDLWSRKRIHPAYLIGTAILLIAYLRIPLRTSEVWLAVGRPIIEVLLRLSERVS